MLRRLDRRYEPVPQGSLLSGTALFATDGRALAICDGERVDVLRWDGASLASAWSGSLPSGRTAMHVSLSDGVVCVCDDASTVTIFDAAGVRLRALQLGETPLTEPICIGTTIVVANRRGVDGYAIGPPRR